MIQEILTFIWDWFGPVIMLSVGYFAAMVSYGDYGDKKKK
jgi:hypothetical protein